MTEKQTFMKFKNDINKLSSAAFPIVVCSADGHHLTVVPKCVWDDTDGTIIAEYDDLVDMDESNINTFYYVELMQLASVARQL